MFAQKKITQRLSRKRTTTSSQLAREYDKVEWHDESKEMVPVPCILFAHNGIDSRTVFASDGHAGKSVYKTAYEMLTMLKMPCSGVTAHPHFGT